MARVPRSGRRLSPPLRLTSTCRRSLENAAGLGINPTQLWTACRVNCLTSFLKILDNRAPATPSSLAAIGVVAAVLGVSHEHVVNGVTLPAIPIEITVASLRKLRELCDSPLAQAFVDDRLREIEVTR
jgi:hypothetical protein